MGRRLHGAAALVNRRYDGHMSIGAIVIPLVALAVCGAAMWLAWRIVKFADTEGDGLAPIAPTQVELPQVEGEARRPSATRKAGIVIAVLAMLVGLGGIAFVVWRAFGG